MVRVKIKSEEKSEKFTFRPLGEALLNRAPVAESKMVYNSPRDELNRLNRSCPALNISAIKKNLK